MKCITLICSVIMLLSVSVLKAQTTGVPATMEVGTETWLKEDLSVTESNPTEPYDSCQLVNAATNEEWEQNAKKMPTYSWYNNNDKATESKLGNGLLYNWYAVKCNICPSGFRIPTDEELKELIAFQAKEKKDVGDGIRHEDGKFMYRGSTQKTYWSSTETADGRAKNGCAYTIQGISWSDPVPKAHGYYIRCIKIKKSVPKITESGAAAVFAFGYGTSEGSSFNTFTDDNKSMKLGNTIEKLSYGKIGNDEWWSIAQNTTLSEVKDQANKITYPPLTAGTVVMHPGSKADQRTKIKYMALSDGSYEATVNWEMVDADSPITNKVLVEVWSNGGGSWKEIWTKTLVKGKKESFSQIIALKKGEVIHFEVERAGDFGHDSTQATFGIMKVK